MVYTAIDNLILWMERGSRPEDFYGIFRIPFPNKPEIKEAINEISLALDSYKSFGKSIEKNEVLFTKFQPFYRYSANILGYSAIAIKLAGEGYIGESLTVIRSSLDVLITSLFASLIWKPIEAGQFNPLGEMYSQYYHLLREINIDDVIINRIGIGEEKEGIGLEDKINEATSTCLKDYFDAFGWNQEEIDTKKLNDFRGIIRKSLSSISADILKQQRGLFKKIGLEVTKPEEFLMSLMQDERYTYKSCKNCEDKLLNDLKTLLLGKGTEMTEEIKNNLRSQLTFKWDVRDDKNVQNELILCDYCGEAPAEIWSIHVRFDKDSMLKYLKWHIDKELLREINNCVGKAFNTEGNEFFGDILNYKIYREMNPYAHGDPKEEPNISQWYNLYMKPYLKSLTCIYKNIVKA